MREHTITFTFSELTAERDLLDGSDAVRYADAARQMLAVHAFFYTAGRVPNGGALNQTKHYQVYKATNRAGCFVDPWVVGIIGGALGTVLGTYGVRAADYTFEHFLRDSLGPIIRRNPSSMPLEMRREPYFTPQDARNMPVFDEEPDRAHHWGQLRERATSILPNVARPVGRSAGKLVVSSEEGAIGLIDIHVLRGIMADAQAYRDATIIAALDSLGLRQPRASVSTTLGGR